MDKRTYLIFADKSEDFPVSLRYAAELAKAHNAQPAVIRVIEPHDFTHWGNIESRMREELHKEAEQLVWSVARDIYDLTGVYSSVYIEEGVREETLTRVIRDNPEIKMLILSADTASSNPGPLVSYFMSKGLSQLRVPVLIIPSHIGVDNVDKLA